MRARRCCRLRANIRTIARVMVLARALLCVAGSAPDYGASDGANVLGFVTLSAWSDVELDALPFVEGLVALSLNRGEVNEHVVPVVPRDESEAFFGVEELHGALSQHILSFVPVHQIDVPDSKRTRCETRPSH